MLSVFLGSSSIKILLSCDRISSMMKNKIRLEPHSVFQHKKDLYVLRWRKSNPLQSKLILLHLNKTMQSTLLPYPSLFPECSSSNCFNFQTFEDNLLKEIWKLLFSPQIHLMLARANLDWIVRVSRKYGHAFSYGVMRFLYIFPYFVFPF